MIGQRLGHYEITARIGVGAMGEVYRARDTRLGREVACKVLPEGMASDRKRLSRFQREAKAVAAINHPNIVTIFSVEVAPPDEEGAPPVHFLTMELVSGSSIGELLPPDGFPIERLLELAVPIADAIASAHEHGIVHRDLKPANVMVSEQGGRLKVLDFGVAKLTGSGDANDPRPATITRTADGVLLGTPDYMSPEQARGEAVDTRSDIFSLGVMLFEMATGARPFQGRGPVYVIQSILTDPTPKLRANRPDLPAQLGRIVERCLEKAPEDRHSTAGEVRDELRALQRALEAGTASYAEAPADVAASERRATAERGATWRRIAIAAGAVLAVVLAVVIAREMMSAS